MHCLPRDLQFYLRLNRAIFLPIHFCIFKFEYVRTYFVSTFLYLPFFHPSVLPKAPQAMHRPIFSRTICWFHYLYHHQAFCFGLNRRCIFVSSLFKFWVSACLHMFLFHDLFAISSSQSATKGSAEQSNHTIVVAWPANNFLIVLPASPLAILFLFPFERNIAIQQVYLFHIDIHFLFSMCLNKFRVVSCFMCPHLRARLSRAIHQHIFSRLADAQ